MQKDGVLKTKDNKKIAYRHYQSGHNAIIIIAHGFFNSKEAILLQELKDYLIDDYDVLMFDFRGHGRSSGVFTWASEEHLDLEEVIAYLLPQYKAIGLAGFSFGAGISIQVAEEEGNIDSLIAISAPSRYRGINYHFWNLDIENDIIYNVGKGSIGKGIRPGAFWLEKKNPIEKVAKLKCPVLYIHGGKDWVISSKHSEELYKKTVSFKKLVTIKGGPHAEYLIRKNSDEILPLIKNWFKQTL